MLSPITVRPALPEDYDAVARITQDSYVTAGYYGDADHPYLQKLQDVAFNAVPLRPVNPGFALLRAHVGLLAVIFGDVLKLPHTRPTPS